MAVNVRFRHQFVDRTNKAWTVNFCDTEYTGTAQDIEMATDAFNLEWTAADPFTPVISSAGQFVPIIETAAQETWLNELAQSNTTGRHTVEIRETLDGDLAWCGVIQSDGIEIPYLARPYVAQLHASDDLARLSEVFYNSTGERYAASFPSGNEFLNVHLRRCLLHLRTAHHWADADILIQLSGYYVADDSTNGITDVKVPTEAFTILANNNSELTDHFTCLKVLQEFAAIFGARLVLDHGLFSFHSLAAFEYAPSYVVPNWINYAKNGSAYVVSSGVNVGYDFDDIQKHAGWSTRYLPGVRSVVQPSRYIYIYPRGFVNYMPPLNQIDSYGNSLDGVFYNTLGDAAYLDNSNGGGLYASRMDTQASVSFTAIVGNDADLAGLGTPSQRLIRYQLDVLLAFTPATGPNAGTTYYANNDLTVDNVNTTPLILNDGSLIETPTVTRGGVTWGTNSANRIKFASACIDHDGVSEAIGIDQEFFTQLPAVDATQDSVYGWWQFAGRIWAREDDLTPHPQQSTVDAGFAIGYYYGLQVINTAADLQGNNTLTNYASNPSSGHRETLELPESVFSSGASTGLGYFLVDDGAGNYGVQLSFASLRDDGNDYLGQLVVEDILRMRASPRKILAGPGTINVGVRHAVFNKIYHDGDGTRWALLSTNWNGGSGVCEMEFFELNRETLTIDQGDDGSGWDFDFLNIGAPKYGGGTQNAPPPQPPTFGRNKQTADTLAELQRDKLPTKTRQKLERITDDSGNVSTQSFDVTRTTAGQLRIYEANTGSAFGSVRQALEFNPAQSFNQVWMLPRTTGNTQSVVTFGSTDGGVTNVLNHVTGTAGQVLTMGTNGKPAFETPSASGGGFYTFTGYASWKGTTGEYFNMAGDIRGTAAGLAVTSIGIPEDATAAKFAVFTQGAAGSSTLRLIVNGTLAEAETFSTTAASVTTGTFSTSVSAGDYVSFWLDPTTNPTGATLVVQFTI